MATAEIHAENIKKISLIFIVRQYVLTEAPLRIVFVSGGPRCRILMITHLVMFRVK